MNGNQVLHSVVCACLQMTALSLEILSPQIEGYEIVTILTIVHCNWDVRSKTVVNAMNRSVFQ